MNKYDLIDQNLLYQHSEALSQGEEEAEIAVDYIVEDLQKHNIQHDRYQFEGYFSDPVYGQVSVISPKRVDICAKTRSFGLHLPHGIKGNDSVRGLFPFSFSTDHGNESGRFIPVALLYQSKEDYVNIFISYLTNISSII